MQYFIRGLSMKIFKKITDILAKIAMIIAMAAVCGMVLVIVAELINRNIFKHSFRPTIEIVGICFLWMAFMGLIPLYNESGLMRLDFLITRTHGVLYEILYLITKIFCLMLGVIMIIAYNAQYPFVSTRYYSTFAFKLPYSVQYFPMALAGGFMALKAVQELIDWVIHVVRIIKKEDELK